MAPDKEEFWQWLVEAYRQQVEVEQTEYVDLYYLAERVCKTRGMNMPAFTRALSQAYPHYLKAGFGIALEVDASPLRAAQIARRKHKIVVDGSERRIIAIARRHLASGQERS